MIEIRSFRDILRLFFIFRREFSWAVIVTVAIALLGAFLLPSRYESNARLLVKPGVENTTLPIQAGNRPALIAPSTQRDPILDEEKILTGRPIAHKVAEHYLHEISAYQPKGFWNTTKFYIKKVFEGGVGLLRSIFIAVNLVEKQTPEERLAKRLERDFSVGHASGSNVIDISFTWDDPVIAQRVLSTWIDFYLEERGRIFSHKSLYPFYETETRKASRQIAQIKQQMQEHLQKIESFSVNERLESITVEINKLNAERFAAQNTHSGLLSAIQSAHRELEQLPAEIMTEREISLNPRQQDLHLKLNELQLERARLQRTFKDEAPPIAQIDKSIAALEQQIAAEASHIQRSENRAPNALVVRLKQNILDAQLRSGELMAQIKGLDKRLDLLTQERLKVLGSEPELERLQRELKTAEQNYTLYVDSLEKARIEQELENNRISNIAIAEQATLNLGRVFPKSLAILLLAIPVGVAVGFLTIYLCYLFDQRIHDGGLIEKKFSVPLWATLQDMNNASAHVKQIFAANLYRLYGILPLARVKEKGITIGITSAQGGEGVGFLVSYLGSLLAKRGYSVRNDGKPAEPGWVSLIGVPGLLMRKGSFANLHHADITILVVEARKTTVPVLESVMSIISTALMKVDGIVVNRRHFEIPASVLNLIARLRG
jgi:uncharacterized protein involved in exopolysaccharide biosynthesis